MLFRLRLLTAGESHGPSLVAILEHVPAGLPIDISGVASDLARRQGLDPSTGHPYAGASARMGIEHDEASLLGGVLDGCTTGAPIAIRIANRNHEEWKGKAVAPKTVPRPGHVDLAAAIKYGYDDLRPGPERASARETAVRVAAGAICRQVLAAFGIEVGSYVTAVGGVAATLDDVSLAERLVRAAGSPLRCPDSDAAGRMQAAIRDAAREGETLGGVFEVVATGVPPGLGSHAQWDRRLSARLGGALMSIPAIKGAEIGHAFDNARRPGSAVHDAIVPGDGGETLGREGNSAGGIEGGITNGEPIVVRAAMKPLATTRREMRSVDLATGQPARAAYERSDVCAVPRAAVVGEAVLSLILADALLEKLGGDSMAEIRPRFDALRRATPADLVMSNRPRTFWP